MIAVTPGYLGSENLSHWAMVIPLGNKQQASAMANTRDGFMLLPSHSVLCRAEGPRLIEEIQTCFLRATQH
jgi:hypothetical protein